MHVPNKENWIKEYESGQTKECPFCGHENPEHTCENCRSEISKETCWKYERYCKDCYTYINEELPKIIVRKKEMGIECTCVEPSCGKCLGLHCQDENCITHTPAKKLQWKQRNLKNTEGGKVDTNKEIARLKDIQRIVRAELAKAPGDTTRMSIQEIKHLAKSVGIVTDNNTDGESPEERGNLNKKTL